MNLDRYDLARRSLQGARGNRCARPRPFLSAGDFLLALSQSIEVAADAKRRSHGPPRECSSQSDHPIGPVESPDVEPRNAILSAFLFRAPLVGAREAQ